MRMVLVLLVALALGACGKKKAPQAPASSADEQMTREAEEQDTSAPLEEDDPVDMRSADPQEGGE